MWNKEAPAAGAGRALHSLPGTFFQAGRHSPLLVDSLSAGAGIVSGPRTSQTIGQAWGRQGHVEPGVGFSKAFSASSEVIMCFSFFQKILKLFKN